MVPGAEANGLVYCQYRLFGLRYTHSTEHDSTSLDGVKTLEDDTDDRSRKH